MKTKISLVLILFIICFLVSNAFGGDPEAVQGILCSHMEDTPSNTTTISIQWTVPESYTGFYYTLFTQASEYTTYTFDEDNVAGLLQNTSGQTSYAHTEATDETYYFHVVSVWENEEEDLLFGPTTTYGPIKIDITPPDGSVDAPSTTTSRNVTLSFVSSDAIKIYVSNVTYGDGAELDLSANNPMAWELTDGEGTKRVFVRFLDRAGNNLDTFADIEYNLNTVPMISSLDTQYVKVCSSISIPLRISDTEGGNLMLAATSDTLTLISATEISITGIGGTSQDNAYTVLTAQSENISLTLVLTPEPDQAGSATISLTVTDASAGITSTTFPVIVYFPGDIDQDGEVQLDEVRQTFLYYMGIDTPSTLEYQILNRNEDGTTISLQDLKEVFLLYDAGIPSCK